MKLTAATITDEQIRELNRTKSPITGNCGYLCTLALGEHVHPDMTREQARARCAEIWNTCHAAKETP